MKRFLLSLFLALAASPIYLHADEPVKTGWSVGLLPAVNYNNDLGFQIGGLGQVYHYGDGSLYPQYLHKFEAHAYLYSKGAKQFIVNYDSKHLIPGKRLTLSAQYMDNPLCGFFGFNGAASPYYSTLDLKKSADKDDGIAFYAHHQQRFLFSADVQGSLAPGLTWIGGVQYTWQRYADVSLSPYNGTETLYHQYVETGLIPEEDSFGHRVELKGGLVYDTRDLEANPGRGIYATAQVTGGGSWSSACRTSLLFSADIRQYIPVVPSLLMLAYQVAYKGLVAGSLPFYALPAFNMRGSYSTRIVGNGVAWGSADIRFTAARGTLLKQFFEVGLVAFADAGGVVQPYELEAQRLLGDHTTVKTLDGETFGPYRCIFDPAIATGERLHISVGGGFFFTMNRNFVTAIELGKPLNPQDGNFGLYINLGFSF